MDYAALIGAIAQIAGPLAGQALAGADKEKVLELLQASRDEVGKIDIPKLRELTANLVPDTQLSGIEDDPQYRRQQMEGDAALKGVIDSGGMTLADKAALNQIRNRIAQKESAGRGAIAQDMARRGTLDSGAQLAMQLDNQQDSANRASEAGEQMAAQAQRRAYEAILARSRQAGEGLDRDYRQKHNAAAAQDAINKGNADIRNLTQRWNAGLPQQTYENQMRKAAGMSGQNSNLGNFYQGRADDTATMWSQGSKAVGQGITAAFGDDDWEKKYKALLNDLKTNGGNGNYGGQL